MIIYKNIGRDNIRKKRNKKYSLVEEAI